jgi:ABC-type oligopeptide transport system substrate-binding subunit/class 3 adenylate cyclase
MQCLKCSTENRDGARFCGKCGASLSVVCPECGTELPPDLRFCDACGSQLGTGPEADPLQEAVDAVAERLQRLVPKEYAERLLATRGQVQPERRTVTIVFSDVKGSTAMAEDLDPEDVLDIMSGAFDVLIEPVYRYEGTLARLMGDAVLAFFGAPIAHEDDPERACRAALEITTEARRYAERLENERGITGFNVRVGINTGLVVVGEVGSDLRVEYTAMGDAINLAARMEQSAPPGGILITHDTYRHVRGVFDVLRQEQLRVKGKRQPVQTYLVQRARPRAFRTGMRGVEGIETRMIGREAELSRLQDDFLTAMEDRELHVATIVGEAGVGKSRLLHEFDIWADLLPQQYFFFKGRASQQMQNLPYSLIRDLIAFRFQIQDTDPLPAVRQKLEQGVEAPVGEGEESQRRAHFIGHLLGFELGPSTHVARVVDDAKQIRELGLTFLADYFKALASQDPVLLLLEDLHWADDSSLDVLNHLALALTDQPLMIVSTARPELYDHRPHWGEGQPFHAELHLRPLSKRNARRLVDEILQRVDTVPAALRDMVVRNAEGNPFFVEELIKMLIEDGLIVKAQDQWRLDLSRLAEVRVPSTLTGVLQARLDRLPTEERTIIQQASVVGRMFWDHAVVHINEASSHKLEPTQVLDTLSALRSREMVFQRETTAFAGSQEYIFKNTLLREATYESVLKRLRKVYHGLVADWLMEQAGERAPEYTGLIADHLELAGRTAEASDYLLEAGDRARGLYAHQEAIRAYQRALALLKEQEDHGRAARTLMKLGLTHHTAFDFAKSRRAYDEGFTLWQRVGLAEPAIAPPPAPHALRVAWRGPTTLDPTVCQDWHSGSVIGRLFSGLVRETPEMEVVPDAVRSWEVLEDGRKYIFHLLDHVRWSDGTPLTARDFEFAWKRVLDPAIQSRNAMLLYDVKGARAFNHGELSDSNSVGVRALDRFTLLVELEAPTGYFLQLLAHSAALPLPEHVVRAHGDAHAGAENIVTNGAFRLESWKRGERLVLVRNPDYHLRSSGNVERVELTGVRSREWSAQLSMYEADELDILPIEHFPAAGLNVARRRHAGEYVSFPELATYWLGFVVSQEPFSDPRVRRAFVLAIDREASVEAVTGGAFYPATGGLIPPGMPGHSPGIALPYDPEQARRLLAEAGYPHGTGLPNLEIVTWRARLWQSLVEDLKAQWRENLGVEVTAHAADVYRLFDRLETEPPHMLAVGWVPDYPDPDSFLRVGFGQYATGWRHQTYDSLVEHARQVMDQNERMILYRQADRILVEDVAVLPLSYGRVHLLVKPWVRKYPVSPVAWSFWEDVIIEPH